MVTLFVEGTGLPYKVVPINTSKSEQHLPAFRSINPNGKVPASLDTAVERRGCSIRALSCCTGRGDPRKFHPACTGYERRPSSSFAVRFARIRKTESRTMN
jgi:hypothetical protein